MRDLPDLFRSGDVMVVNDTRVVPARLRARRGNAAVEILLNRPSEEGWWHALVRNARRLRPGDRLTIERAPDLPVRVVRRTEDGGALLDLGPDQATVLALLDRAGEVPLPPYIARPDGPLPEDREDYQAIFARRPGAVAAPTASLHFTEAMLAALDAKGVRRATVTLHVGAGTFLPLRGENPRAERLHAEWGEVSPEAAALINEARPAGGRIVAVGTTALRLLETAATDGDSWARPARPFRGDHRPLPPARLPLPFRRRPADQLPPAAQLALHAGLRLRRHGAHARRLRPRDRRAATASTPMATPA